MNLIKQRTVNQEIGFRGIGIHTGKVSEVVIEPAESNTGIVFVKLPENIKIKATIGNLVKNNYSTTIGLNNVRIATIEHLMAALYGLGIDNATIYVTGMEIPIMDGSSKFFVDVMEDKIKELNEIKKFIKIKNKIKIKINDRTIEYEPSNHHNLIINYKMDYVNYPFLNQEMEYIHSLDTFRLIAGSKTFARNEDVEEIKSLGLGKGMILNDNTRLAMKTSKEDFVSHKILDLLGDIYLLGAPLIGKIRCFKGGHLLHTEFAKKAHNKSCQVIVAPKKSIKSNPPQLIG